MQSEKKTNKRENVFIDNVTRPVKLRTGNKQKLIFRATRTGSYGEPWPFIRNHWLEIFGNVTPYRRWNSSIYFLNQTVLDAWNDIVDNG